MGPVRAELLLGLRRIGGNCPADQLCECELELALELTLPPTQPLARPLSLCRCPLCGSTTKLRQPKP